MKNYAIIIISIGDRPWANSSIKTVEYFCEKNNCDLFVEKENPEELAILKNLKNVGRKNKIAYATKAYVVEKFLSNYKKIAVVDDTICINPHTPNFFKLVPENYIGYNKEPGKDSNLTIENSFKIIKKYIPNFKEFNKNFYMNSGFLIYDKNHKGIFTTKNIIENKNLLLSNFPHQTLTYFLLRKYKCKMFELDKKFHIVPGIEDPFLNRKELKSIGNYFNKNDYVYHFTGTYRYRNLLISETSKKMEELKNE
jgi:hypothetical protein